MINTGNFPHRVDPFSLKTLFMNNVSEGPPTDFFKNLYSLKAHSLVVHMALELSLETKI